MPSRSWASTFLGAALVILLSGIATFLVHRETLHYGFNYDDYHFLWPYTSDDILATFHGTWDVRGVMVPFYRPLTIVVHALRFELFGLNATAHHAVSLVSFALAGAIVGFIVLRFTGRLTAAAAGTVVFVCHPAMPYSLVAWVTNQMHLAQTIVVLTALVYWHAVRARRLIWWLPLLVFATASFLIKEDGVMLLPAIVTLHAVVRRVAERDLQRTPLAFVALAALAIALLLMLRADALGGLGGYGRPSPEAAMRNILRGLDGVYRLVPTDRPWQGVASGFATALPIVALVAWPWISRGARLCLVAGFAIAFLFNLPALFVTKPEQVYFVGLGASLTLTGAVVAMLDLAARTRAPAACDLVLVAVLSVGLAAFVALTRDITRDFEPFGPNVLSNDDIVRTWWTVPTEVHDYLARKREVGAANRMSSNPALELPHAIFGVHGRETSPDGVAYVWMAGARVEIHTSATARLLAIPLRHERGAFREDARVLIDVDGRPADDLLLDSGDWRVSTLSLRPQDVSSSRRMHRIRIAIDHAWQPSTIIPGSTDERVLGLQIGGLSVR